MTLTATELAKYVGRRGQLELRQSDLTIPVETIDAKVTFGTVRLQVRVIGGNDKTEWVEAERIKFDDA